MIAYPKLVHGAIHADSRGVFRKLFPLYDASGSFFDFDVKQINLSVNALAGTIRGLHIQGRRWNEGKIVNCVCGSIFDVVVDVRESSPDFLRSFTFELKSDSHSSLLIPPGFAHGFQTLEPNTVVLYAHSEDYKRDEQFGINPFDLRLDIRWPLEPTNISARDLGLPNVDDFTTINTRNF